MKKNVFMRAALLLLVLTLITSCFVGGTFAKYISTNNGTDSARVANWGWEPVALNFENLFLNSYTDVVGEENAEVIAPGTSGSCTFAFAYNPGTGTTKPEVDYSFVVSTDGSSCADEIQANTNIQWKLDDGNWGTWTQLIAAIQALDGDEDYKAGELPTGFTATDDVHTVSWQWLFGSTDEENARDTALGNMDTLSQVTLKITITATQLDNTPIPTEAPNP